MEDRRGAWAPIVFLDFDGVLHPNLCAPSAWFSRLGLLEEAFDGVDEALIVIASSWRFQHSYAALRRRFPASLRKRLWGTTGDAYVGAHARFHEIQQWLRRHAPGIDEDRWRTLDDAAFEFPAGCRQLIHCDGAFGISEREVALLRDWLARRRATDGG
jgi:hypothetical protein